MALDAASFKISIDSTSSRLKWLPGLILIPSTIQRGSVFPIEPTPRIWIVGLAPGAPPPLDTKTPEAIPCNDWSRRLIGRSLRYSTLTEETEPVRLDRFS